MLPKSPKTRPIAQKLLGGLFIFEAVAFGAAWFGWSKINKDRDFRFKLKDSFPWLLEKYYEFGELIGKDNVQIRQQDQLVWEHNKKKQVTP